MRWHWWLAVGMLAGGCILPPGDAAQIRALVRERAAAIAHANVDALYRMHDLDYRAVCPSERFRSLPLPPAGDVRQVREVQIRGSRGTALVEVTEGDTTRFEEHAFVRDAGRWYLYEDAAPCLDGGVARRGGRGGWLT